MSLVKDGEAILLNHVEELHHSGTINTRAKNRLEYKIQQIGSEISAHYNRFGKKPTEQTDESTVSISEMSDEELSKEFEIMSDHEDSGTLTPKQKTYLKNLKTELLDRVRGDKELRAVDK